MEPKPEKKQRGGKFPFGILALAVALMALGVVLYRPMGPNYLIDGNQLVGDYITINAEPAGIFGSSRMFMFSDAPVATFTKDGESFPFDMSDGNLIQLVPVYESDMTILSVGYFVCDSSRLETCSLNPDKLRFLRPVKPPSNQPTT